MTTEEARIVASACELLAKRHSYGVESVYEAPNITEAAVRRGDMALMDRLCGSEWKPRKAVEA